MMLVLKVLTVWTVVACALAPFAGRFCGLASRGAR